MIDVHKVQDKWQKKWRDAKLFEVDIAPSKEKLFVTVPYPYISGSLHIGHARVVTEMDVYSRYYRMLGKNVLFPIAFHISGTPVLGISAAIKNRDEKKVDMYKGYVRNYVKNEKEVEKTVHSFENPKKIVEFFIPKMKDEFSKLGLAVDWRRSFTSGDVEHQKLVEWQFKKYKVQGYILQGKYPVLYCVNCENAVGEDDIVDGDTSPVDKQEFTLLKFEFEDSYLVAATLRPETMYGQTNMWVNPEIDYVKILVGKEKWVVSEECAKKLGYQDKKIRVLEKVPGKSLVGKHCKAPVVERRIIILPSEFCNPNIATGFVTSVPSDAPFDWIALKDLQNNKEICKKYGLDIEAVKNITPIPIIKSKGYGDFPAKEIIDKLGIKSQKDSKKLEEATQEIYKIGFHTGIMMETCGPYRGMRVVEAKEAMKKDLLAKGKADVFYETSRAANCRCGGEVVVAILGDQWFLDFNAKGWKDKARKMLAKMEIQPDKYRKQFEDVFEWLDKRPCARRRGLGAKLPFDKEWVIESLSDSTIYMSLYTICHKIREFKIGGEKLNDVFFDYVMLGKGESKKVSAELKIPAEHLKVLREEFDYWYPNDHRHTFPAHLPNHLSFSIFAHAAVFPEKYWTKKFSFHGMVLSEGQKMGKSKGNVVTLLDVDKKFGADVFRAFMCNSTSVESALDWKESEVERLNKHLSYLLGLLEQIIKNKGEGEVPAKYDYFVSKFERSIKKATESISKMNLREYSTAVLYDLAHSYKKIAQTAPEHEIKIINGYVAERWIKMLTPLIPHCAEELWGMNNGKGFVSTEEWPMYYPEKISEEAEFKEELLEQVSSDINTVKELLKLDKLKKVALFVADEWKFEFVRLFKERLEQTRNPGEIIKALMETSLKKHGQDIANLVPKLVKDPSKVPLILLDVEKEEAILKILKDNLEKKLDCKIEIIKEKDSKEAKAKQAMPAKPAILIS